MPPEQAVLPIHRASPFPPDPVAEIEARQDEVLRQLDELNVRLEQVLGELAASPAILAAGVAPRTSAA